MPRIPEVPTAQAGRLTRLVYRLARRRFGAVPQPMTVMAHNRRLLIGAGLAELAGEKTATVLPASVRSLAEYRVATRIGCSWCVDFGAMLQRDAGLDVERLKEIDHFETSERFSEADRLVVAYADAMTDQPMRVTDAQVADLDARFGHAGLVELTYVIAVENERTRFNHALGLTSQGFASGAACQVPMP